MGKCCSTEENNNMEITPKTPRENINNNSNFESNNQELKNLQLLNILEIEIQDLLDKEKTFIGTIQPKKIKKSSFKELPSFTWGKGKFTFYGQTQKSKEEIPNGYGELYSKTAFLAGNWSNGIIKGKFIIIEKNRWDGLRVFKITAQDSKMENWMKFTGVGERYYINGEKYIGQWEEGVENGKGNLFGESGKLQFEGEWKDGKPDGFGTLYDENGNVSYEGEWKNGQPNISIG